MSDQIGAAAPNILIVLSDQLRRQALSCYGDPDAITPHIAQMARDGVAFDRACSTYPICVPFRFTMMTGEYAHTRLVPGIEWRMSPAERTLADEFNDADYETIAGYVLETLRRIPRQGERMGLPGGATLLVRRANDRAVLEVLLSGCKPLR